jgi:hypothetical protein
MTQTKNDEAESKAYDYCLTEQYPTGFSGFKAGYLQGRKDEREEMGKMSEDEEKAIDEYASLYCITLPVGEEELKINKVITEAMRKHVRFGLALGKAKPEKEL